MTPKVIPKNIIIGENGIHQYEIKKLNQENLELKRDIENEVLKGEIKQIFEENKG